jgi:cation-transporting ATPase E
MEKENKDFSGELYGLTSEQVDEQRALGHVNISREKAGKSYLRIIFDNLFTFFNMVWAIIAVVLIACGSYTNLTFMFIVIPNILIATVQEIRAKKTVEKLSVTTEPKAVVVRDGKECEINVKDIVLGDVMRIELGKQVLSDGIVLDGVAEANESMLTGEADAIKKQAGDKVLAGSFLVSGAIYVKVTAVGDDNYVHTIESAAKGFKAPASNLFHDLNNLIKYIGIFMIPMTALMAVTNFFDTGKDFVTTVEKTSGSVIGMIPSGIYLLITVTLTLSVMILSKKRTLVQDMYSIEMLASADVICLDKTGTITDGTMCVCGVELLSDASEDRVKAVISMIEGAEESLNNTSRALVEHFGQTKCEIKDKIPFSSKRKYSAVEISGEGSFAIGAPGFVPCEIDGETERKIAERANEGQRVLVLAELDSLHGSGKAIAMVAIADRIRPNAGDVIANFQSQGVSVKIISGDHAATVSTIAKRVGVSGAENYISCTDLSDEEIVEAAEKYTVFGRVTPEQKVLLVKALKANGHTVAMTGDGVNDTLALKESNCAIAMADGSEVARAVSQIVLLDSDFAALPEVVKEGRRCINNVRNSAALFLMKTVFVICLSIFAVCVPGMTYPFEPKQFLLLEFFVIGISSVLLALEPNYSMIKGSFLKTVMLESIPSALGMYLPVLLILILGSIGVGISTECFNAVAMIVVTLVGYVNLVSLCIPFTRWRASVCIGIGLALAAAAPLSVFAADLLALIPGDLLSLPRDILGFLPAFENVGFLIGMVGVGLSLGILIQVFKKDLKRIVFNITDKIKGDKT